MSRRPTFRLQGFAWVLLLLASAVDLHALAGDDHGTVLSAETFYLCQADEHAPASHAEAARAVTPEDCLVCQHREHSRGLVVVDTASLTGEVLLAAAAALPVAPPRPPHRRAGHGRAPPRS